MKEKTQLFFKYQKQWSKNPSSQVFVPLAESYRQMGLLDQAIGTLKDGLKYRPNYYLAYIILGRCYFDKEDYQACYRTLLPLVDSYPDNKILHSIYAQACEQLGKYNQALLSYKLLLYYDPKDKWLQKKVCSLEDIEHTQLKVDRFQVVQEKRSQSKDLLPNMAGWEEKDFASKILPLPLPIKDIPSSSPDSSLLLKEQKLINEPKKASEDKMMMDHDLPQSNKESWQRPPSFYSLTLVSILESQHQYQKALQVVEKILELRGPDEHLFTRKKVLQEKLMSRVIPQHQVDDHGNDGQKIMKIAERSPEPPRVEEILTHFLSEMEEKCLSKNPLTNRILQRLKP
jgi:tetratricopeptide (TPR) repeat protein